MIRGTQGTREHGAGGPSLFGGTCPLKSNFQLANQRGVRVSPDKMRKGSQQRRHHLPRISVEKELEAW